MPQYLATRKMTVLGDEYEAGEPIPIDRLDPRRARQIIDQRQAYPDRIDVGGHPSGDGPDVEVVHKSGKWYDVQVNGVAVNEKGIEEDEAELLAAKIRAGQ